MEEKIYRANMAALTTSCEEVEVPLGPEARARMP